MASTDSRPAEDRAAYEPDDADRALMNEMQTAFPLVARPFATLGARLDLSEAEILDRLVRLKAARLVRQVSAIFDSRKLGYTSSLVAMRFAPDDLEAGAAVINQHPGVSHNYKRNHAYNLWFTIAVPPHKTLDGEVGGLARKADAGNDSQTLLSPVCSQAP